MEELRKLLEKIEKIKFTADQRCIERLGNCLHDSLEALECMKFNASAEWLDLKSCAWVIHERYHMEEAEQMKWTFHHSQHRMTKNLSLIIERMEERKRAA